MHIFSSLSRVLILTSAALSPLAQAVTPAEQLAAYSAQAGVSAQAARGQQLFTSKHGKDWSCASCHTAAPTVQGKHATTAKPISPLAPAFNPERFTDTAKTENGFAAIATM